MVGLTTTAAVRTRIKARSSPDLNVVCTYTHVCTLHTEHDKEKEKEEEEGASTADVGTKHANSELRRRVPCVCVYEFGLRAMRASRTPLSKSSTLLPLSLPSPRAISR